jgi:drug/metabolite transporter (DMT)-like permease
MIHSQNTTAGALFGFISALSFALMSVFVKLIGTELPVAMLVFARFAISFILLLPWLVTAQNFSFKVQSPFRYTSRILSALLALFFTFYAIKFIPLVDVLLLNNTSPLFVPMIAWFMTGAKTPPKATVGIVLGFVGIAIILEPGQDIFSAAALFALLAGFLSAVAIVQMRLLSKESPILQMLFYYFAVSCLISGIATVAEWQMPSNMQAWLLLLAIGIFGTLYQVFATLSYAKAPVRLMAPLTFLSVVFGGYFDWLIWNHIPTPLTMIGAILVICGALITIYFGQKGIALQQRLK